MDQTVTQWQLADGRSKKRWCDDLDQYTRDWEIVAANRQKPVEDLSGCLCGAMEFSRLKVDLFFLFRLELMTPQCTSRCEVISPPQFYKTFKQLHMRNSNNISVMLKIFKLKFLITH